MFENLETKTATRIVKMLRCNTFSKVLLIFIMLQYQESLAMPMIDDELIISDGHNHHIRKIHYNQPSVRSIYNSEPSYDKILNLKQELVTEAEKMATDMLIESLKENKAYVEYIIESEQQPEISSNRIQSKKHIFKADKNLKRLEKKSWKIPMKTLALYTENSHQGQNMMDELTEVFNSFKNSGR